MILSCRNLFAIMLAVVVTMPALAAKPGYAPTEVNIELAMNKKNGNWSKFNDFAVKKLLIGESVQFMQDAASYYHAGSDDRATLGPAIYKKYVKDNAPRQINISAAMSRKITADVKKNTKDDEWPKGLFVKARTEIMSVVTNKLATEPASLAKWMAFAPTLKDLKPTK